MADVLLDLVVCEALRGSFPSGVPRRGCVRRQLERKRDGKEWAPAHPGCVGCEIGRQVRAEVEAQGVELGTCEKHGAAIVGEPCDVCEADRIAKGKPCPACGGVERHAASGCSRKWRKSVGETTPATYRGPVSTLIWAGEVPDVPIAPPPQRGTGLSAGQTEAAAERVREALARPTVVAAPPAGAETARRIEHPTEPAPRAVVGIIDGHQGLPGGTDASAARLAAPRQTTAWTAVMTEKTCRCGCGRQLRKNNTTGFSGYCNTNRYAAGERPPRPSRAKESTMPCKTCGKPGHNARGCTETKTKAAPATAAGAGRRGARGGEERLVTGKRISLSEATVEDLVKLRTAIDEEFRIRKEKAQAELARIDAATGKAA